MIAEAAEHVGEGVYLRSYLAPLSEFLTRLDVTDIYVNRPGEVWLETTGGRTERHFPRTLTEGTLARLVKQVAALTNQGINREYPLMSAMLPEGARIQVVAPPATRGNLALAIRKQAVSGLKLADIVARGGFDCTNLASWSDDDNRQWSKEELANLDNAALLVKSVLTRKNILISGGTSTGKTTFLNALLSEIPYNERIILIEDTPELMTDHPNQVGLVATRGSMGEASVTANDLVTASLRLRPDRIILGELRGNEAFAFLRAINSGHPGSMTTVHANSPKAAVDQIALLVLQTGIALRHHDVAEYVRRTIDVYVQLGRSPGGRCVECIALPS